jgi:hypothetical protein
MLLPAGTEPAPRILSIIDRVLSTHDDRGGDLREVFTALAALALLGLRWLPGLPLGDPPAP